MSPSSVDARLEQLHRERPQRRFVRWSIGVLVALIVAAWTFGGFDWRRAFSAQRWTNLKRFLSEATPQPLRDGGDFGDLLGWGWDLFLEAGLASSATTLGIAVAAIILASAGAIPFSLGAARNLSDPEPFLPSGARPNRTARWGWNTVVGVCRVVMVFLRAIPEYVWAFVLLAMLGPSAWPAVLALALHNLGIVGRLGAEVIENVDPRTPAALRGIGASRLQIAAIDLAPRLLPRLLLYFFYRWETCVREATILGLLGFSSLGYWIIDARARDRYDTMLYFVILGAVLVLIGDLVSAVVRAWVRRR